MTPSAFSLPAEWHPSRAVIIAWPHAGTDWAPILGDVRATYAHLICELSKLAEVIVLSHEPIGEEYILPATRRERVRVVDYLTNDTWARDYGPVTLLPSSPEGRPLHLDFCFNGWGMKFAACRDNLATTHLAACGLLDGDIANHRDMVLEGGSIDSDGCGTVLTTAQCLLAPNRNDTLDRDAIDAELRRRLGARRILWLEHGALAGDDTDGHVDTIVRFLPPSDPGAEPDTIAFAATDDTSDANYAELRALRAELESLRRPDGMPYRLVPLMQPHPETDDDGMQLPATYANFLIVNGAILLPTYRQPDRDSAAAEALRRACPSYTVVPVDCRTLIEQHGSLHCATMQLPAI